MVIKLLNIFEGPQWTDQEKLALWFMAQFMRRYGWKTEYFIHSKDAKVIFRGSTAGAIGLSSFRKYEKYFKFGEYSEFTYSFALSKNYYSAVDRYGSIGSEYRVEITDPKVIAIYVYLLGALNPNTKWATNGIKIEDNFNQRPAAIAAFDLSQLLNCEINLDI